MADRLVADRTLTDAALRVLREEVLSGELAPGTRLILSDLAGRLGMSIIPVREALMRLHSEGLVEQTAHKGARVSGVWLEDMEDLYRVRIKLETMAVQDACKHITDADYRRLEEVLQAYRSAHRRKDAAEGWRLHSEFHLGLYELSGSNWLLRAIRPLWDSAERYQRISVQHRPRGSIDVRHDEHRAILDACARHDPEAAAFALEQHLRRTIDLVEFEPYPTVDEERAEDLNGNSARKGRSGAKK